MYDDLENPMVWDGREEPYKPWWKVKQEREEQLADEREDDYYGYAE